MTRYTYAYKSFIDNIDEVESLRSIALQKERENPIKYSSEINSLCRGSIVLLSSHLEAYIRELGELLLGRIYEAKVLRGGVSPVVFYHISKDLLDQIGDTSDAEKIAKKVLAFINRDGDFWSQTGSFPRSIPVERFNVGFANPSYSQIKKYFNRFGYSSYNNDLRVRMKADFDPIRNMVNHLVATRNQIAHGDPSATKTPSEVCDMALLVRKFCVVTDSVFGNWCRGNLCTIR
jgi:hypothetical protein